MTPPITLDAIRRIVDTRRRLDRLMQARRLPVIARQLREMRERS